MSICGGPEPRTRAACYGGCYEWCYMADLCTIPKADLTAAQHREIRTFQRRSGGCFQNDLRTVNDFDLTPAMVRMMTSLGYQSATSRNQTANAIERRGLIGWWGDDLDDMYDKSKPGHWHLMGEGGNFLLVATGKEPSLCACVGGAPRD